MFLRTDGWCYCDSCQYSIPLVFGFCICLPSAQVHTIIAPKIGSFHCSRMSICCDLCGLYFDAMNIERGHVTRHFSVKVLCHIKSSSIRNSRQN